MACSPVRLRYADSLARPGRNVTGLTTLAGDLTVKWLELLREFRRVMALGTAVSR